MMTKQRNIQIGDLVHVRTEYKYGARHSVTIKSGRVIKSERHDHKDTFRLYTGDPQYPVSVIAYERITGLKLREVA